MRQYADSSFLVSLYGSDSNSARADLCRQANPEPLPFTPLHRVEFRNALWLAVFQRRCAKTDAHEIWRNVEADLASGVLVLSAASFGNLWQNAETLIEPHTPETGARSLDILHVAAAKLLNVEEFVTFDQRQAALAERVGLKVVTP
ncbi:MAG: type II toxin-antitoxin system VapC family toxin [Verrucomicrobia bacterium]|nr:type II toxin-antitoxin system VapC family toxin [Verrucomicrobiota bacterium]